jgi:hypothetical protein
VSNQDYQALDDALQLKHESERVVFDSRQKKMRWVSIMELSASHNRYFDPSAPETLAWRSGQNMKSY